MYDTFCLLKTTKFPGCVFITIICMENLQFVVGQSFHTRVPFHTINKYFTLAILEGYPHIACLSCCLQVWQGILLHSMTEYWLVCIHHYELSQGVLQLVFCLDLVMAFVVSLPHRIHKRMFAWIRYNQSHPLIVDLLKYGGLSRSGNQIIDSIKTPLSCHLIKHHSCEPDPSSSVDSSGKGCLLACQLTRIFQHLSYCFEIKSFCSTNGHCNWKTDA